MAYSGLQRYWRNMGRDEMIEEYSEGPCYSHDWDDHKLVDSTDWNDYYTNWSEYNPGFYFIHKEDGPAAGPFEDVDAAMLWLSKKL